MAEISSTEFPEFPSILNVLVIDSDLNVLDFIKKTCNQYSYQVMACSESLNAVNILRERKTNIHLILIEVYMPVMDGYEFLLFVKKEGINVPVIVMSHDDSKPCIMKTVQLGACDYWKKPLNEDIMIKNMWTHAFRKFLGEDRTQKNTDRLDENDKTREDASSVVDRNKSNFRKDDDVDESENSNPLATGKDRIVWTPELHTKFLDALKRVGPEKAVPKKILEAMNMPNLKRGHVASHMQKYRKFLKEQEEKQQQQNEHNEMSDNKKPRVSEENNFQPGLTCNIGPTREKSYDPNVQVAEHFHAEPTLTHDLSYPLATFPNISITTNFPQSSGFGLNNMQQPMMRPQIPPINLQPSSIVISDNSASVPQNYNFRMNMPPQSIPGENNIGQFFQYQYNNRASMYYPQPQNAGFSNGVVRSFAASKDIDDQTIKKQLNSTNNGHHKP
ncbi:hypothetical protein V8G54_001904 [Vigna mungo]|uniref:Two-component response regulator n=1 Tax=Vigna mungo TaxID=3915 RepID=A0AAQ3P952_VIGMU